MNRIRLLALLTALTATGAYAQQSFDPVVPRGLSDQRVEPAGEPARAAPPRLVQNERRAQRDADARECLEQATNKAIHRCSLKYRSHASRAASVKKTSAKPPAAPKPAESAQVSAPASAAAPAAPTTAPPPAKAAEKK